MNDDHVAELLGPFHLGALDDPDYDRVEGHLMGCPTCIAGYLSLKRRIDRSMPLDLRPSAQVRLAIRQQVSSSLLPVMLRPRKRLLAMGAAAAAVALLALFLARHTHSPQAGVAPSPMIDSATPSPLL